MSEDSRDPHEAPDEDIVETPKGRVTLVYLGGTAARVASGRDVGWLRLHDAPLYATARFELEGGSWILNRQHSAVAAVVDDKAGPVVGDALCEEAWAFLAETFAAWREARPDIAARVTLHERSFEERKVEKRIEALLRDLESLRADLPGLRQARLDAEADVERALSAIPGGPRP